ncbi:MAG TPA: EthD family reductase [Chloroflexota bacterium]|nr:EthD family reductase [Chloroflexota bacterium]
MLAVVILYTHPEQVSEFERRYVEEYVPLIRRLPGVTEVTIQRVVGAPLGDPAYMRMETWRLRPGVTPETLLVSAEWRAAQEVLRFARGLSTMMVVEEEAMSG